MTKTITKNRYILLPDYGYTSHNLESAGKLLAARPTVAGTRTTTAGGTSNVKVLESLHENGPKLVEMSSSAELDLQAEMPGLKIVPLVRFEKLRNEIGLARLAESAGPKTISLSIKDAKTGAPIAGARVVAFTNYRHRTGAEANSGANGVARLALAQGTKLERLYVFGPALYWSRFEAGFVLASGKTVQLAPIDLTAATGALARFANALPANTGADVKVGVLDTGIQKDHPALPNVSGGRNMVFDETDGNPGTEVEWGPATTDGDHGTHVAGAVGMNTTANSMLRGVAPGAEIRAYRVFPNSGQGATNYDIMRAIDSAVADGCDILNLSLGGGDADEATRAAIGNAADKGVLVIAAAGNDGRKAVSYPAAFPAAVAVSAMGWQGSFPAESTESAEIVKPFGNAKDDFVAGFSNIGPQISFTGPGVGILSTIPGSAWGAMSGTSMASPAVAGFAAHILSQRPAILNAARNADRTRAIRNALEKSAVKRGFGRDYEGFGLPQ